MLSSLFTTLDVNRQADSFEGASSQTVTSSESTQNPVGVAAVVLAGLFRGGCVCNIRVNDFFSGGCCAAASVPFDPETPQQVA